MASSSQNPYRTTTNNFKRPSNPYTTKSAHFNPYNNSLNYKPDIPQINTYGTLFKEANIPLNKTSNSIITDDFTFPNGITLTTFVKDKLYETVPYATLFGEGTFSKVYLLSFNNKSSYILKIVNTKPTNIYEPPPASLEINALLHLNKNYPELDKYHNKLLGYILYNKPNKAAILLSFTPGMTFEEWLKTNSSKNDKQQTINNIYKSLEKLHQAGIVHRDLKPDNIWIPHNKSLPPRFMDFSHALFEGDEYKTPNGRKYRATRKNNIKSLNRLRTQIRGGKRNTRKSSKN